MSETVKLQLEVLGGLPAAAQVDATTAAIDRATAATRAQAATGQALDSSARARSATTAAQTAAVQQATAAATQQTATLRLATTAQAGLGTSMAARAAQERAVMATTLQVNAALEAERKATDALAAAQERQAQTAARARQQAQVLAEAYGQEARAQAAASGGWTGGGGSLDGAASSAGSGLERVGRAAERSEVRFNSLSRAAKTAGRELAMLTPETMALAEIGDRVTMAFEGASLAAVGVAAGWAALAASAAAVAYEIHGIAKANQERLDGELRLALLDAEQAHRLNGTSAEVRAIRLRQTEIVKERYQTWQTAQTPEGRADSEIAAKGEQNKYLNDPAAYRELVKKYEHVVAAEQRTATERAQFEDPSLVLDQIRQAGDRRGLSRMRREQG